MFVGNDLCPDPSICLADVNVVTRSQTAALRKQAESIHDKKENSSVTALDSQSDVTTNHTNDPMSDLSQLFNGDSQTLICVLVARPRRCLTLSNPVP